MSMAELKKIIIDGKNKFKAYDEADKALQAFESMEQAERDLTKKIENLKKSADFLLQKNQAAQDGINGAEKKASEILAGANDQAEKLLARSKHEAESYNLSLATENEKLKSRTLLLQDQIDRLDGQKKTAEAEFEKISSALNAAKADLKKLLG
jgi:chromosome segregation ATPase